MSYEIYFLRTKELNSENIHTVLEDNHPSVNSYAYISKSLMESLIAQLKSNKLNFTVKESDTKDYYELNFPTYQIAMFNSEVVLSVPFWDENETNKIDTEIKKISNVLLQNGFIGFEPQMEEIINTPYKLKSNLKATNEYVKENHSKSNDGLFIGIILGFLILVFLIWKFIIKS